MRIANLGTPSYVKTEILPINYFTAAIARLDASTAPVAATRETSLLAQTFLPLIEKNPVPSWINTFRPALERTLGTKKKIKKEKMQGGEFGIILVMRLFKRMSQDSVRDVWGDCNSWINRIVAAMDSQSAAFETPFSLPEFDQLRLGTSSPFTEDNPRPKNPSSIANFPPEVLLCILEAMYTARNMREPPPTDAPISTAHEQQSSRHIFQRVCHAWSLITGQSDFSVTGLKQTLRLSIALRAGVAGRTGTEIKSLTIDFRKQPKANFEGCGKALANLLESCINLDRLELILPGPGVEGEEIVGLASLAGAFHFTARLKRLILRVIPEVKRMRNGERKMAAPLSLRLSILSPILCRAGLLHLEVYGVIIAKARLAGRIECRLETFKSSWQGDNSSLFAILAASRTSLIALTLIECYTVEPFARSDLATFLATVAPTLRRLTLIECNKDLPDALYIEKFVSSLTGLTHLTLGTTGFTNHLFDLLPRSLHHLSVELTKQLLPPATGNWPICEFLKTGRSDSFRTLAVVPEPTAKVVLGNGSVWKLNRSAEKGSVKLILPPGWRL